MPQPEDLKLNALDALEEFVAADHATWDTRLLQRDFDVAGQSAVAKQDGKVVVPDQPSKMSNEVLNG